MADRPSLTIVAREGREPPTGPMLATGDGHAVPAWVWVRYPDPRGAYVAYCRVETDPTRTPPSRCTDVEVRASDGGEVSARMLQRLPVSAIVEEAAGMFVAELPDGMRNLPVGEELEEPVVIGDTASGFVGFGVGPSAEAQRAEQRRQWHGRERLARVARAYVMAADAGEPTARAVVDELGGDLSEGRARNLVREAREAGLLTPTTRGRKGGELTPQAVALLRDLDDDEEGDRWTAQ